MLVLRGQCVDVSLQGNDAVAALEKSKVSFEYGRVGVVITEDSDLIALHEFTQHARNAGQPEQ